MKILGPPELLFKEEAEAGGVGSTGAADYSGATTLVGAELSFLGMLIDPEESDEDGLGLAAFGSRSYAGLPLLCCPMHSFEVGWVHYCTKKVSSASTNDNNKKNELNKMAQNNYLLFGLVGVSPTLNKFPSKRSLDNKGGAKPKIRFRVSSSTLDNVGGLTADL